LNREEKSPARVNPLPIGMERTGGDQAMQVQVLGERLAPSVQDQGCGDLAAEPARTGAELDEGGRDAFEEHAVEQPRITLGERVERVRQGKHEMEIRHRQQLGAPGANLTSAVYPQSEDI